MEFGPAIGRESPPEEAGPSPRLDSWKQIAAYFGRDVRTVRRWERHESLPVHRHLHRSRSSVYAFQHELDAWRAQRHAQTAGSANRGDPWRSYGLPALVISLVLAIAGWVFVQADRRASGEAPASRADAVDARTRRSVLDPDVRHALLLARHHLDRRANFRRETRESLESAIARAPDLAEAHALLGEVRLRQALYDRSRHPEAWRDAEASVRRALSLDATLATAHAVLSRILLLRDWNWTGAAEESLRAIELDPSAADARSAYALYLQSAGRLSEATLERERVYRADPLNPQSLVFLGDTYLFSHRYEEATHAYQRALELERDYRPAVASLADVLERMGRDADAASWRSRLLMLRGQQDLATAFDDVREREGAGAAIEWLDRRNLDELLRSPDEHLWDIAYTHARLDNAEAALLFLERAYERREPGLLQARVDPDLDSLRTDRRFIALLERIGPR
jgi:tetratricopeptide (TPR) repeat protein